MAEDMKKGINVLLHPEFTELKQRLERLEVYHRDLASVVAQKEDCQEVERLRDHFDSQIKQVDTAVGMLKDKVMGLDELRNQEIRSLSTAVEQRATLANLNHLNDQLQASNVSMTMKADVSKVEQLCKQFHTLSEEVALRARSSRAEQLGQQLQATTDSLARKADVETTDRIMERLRVLTGEVSFLAEDAKLQELSKRFDTLTAEVGQKADDTRLQQLDRQVHVLEEELGHRADTRKVDHLTRQLHSLGEEVAQKAEAAHTDQAIRQIHALSDTMSQKVEGQKHNFLCDQVLQLREDVFSMKAHVAKLDDHSRQLESLHGTVATDSARVKQLCLMYANAAGGKDPLQTPSPVQRGRHSPAGTAHKPGAVTLPSMAPTR